MNVSTLRETSEWVREVDVSDDKIASEKYDQSACSEQRSYSMLGERTALRTKAAGALFEHRKASS